MSQKEISFWDKLETFLMSFINSSKFEENDKEFSSEFSIGESVWVKENKFGTIIGLVGNSYTVKLKDENGNEYSKTFEKEELERYY